MAIVYPRDNWILQRSGEELDGLEVKGTYFINYAMFDETMPKPWGGFFTHREPATERLFERVASQVEYAVCINENVKRYLESRVPRVEIIRHGHDPRVKKDIVFGVSGVKYSSGRKGEDLVETAKQMGYKIEWNEDFEKQPDFYKRIDYLLIPSRIEGGPVPVLDAIASGVPVIAREGLGWCDEFPVIRYKDDKNLFEVLHLLTNPPNWSLWRQKHKLLFQSI
jgi:hypothetical protein